MNKQIKELYTQVCMEQKLPFTVEHNSAVMLDAFANKFAELIVRECAEVVTDAVDQREPASTYADKIKQHFGVEE